MIGSALLVSALAFNGPALMARGASRSAAVMAKRERAPKEPKAPKAPKAPKEPADYGDLIGGARQIAALLAAACLRACPRRARRMRPRAL